MSTGSLIGIEKTVNGKRVVELVYCHADGYPAHHGPLLKNYDTEESVQELISHGGMSVLGSRIGEKIPFDTPSEERDGQCVFFDRDRGETDTPSETIPVKELARYFEDYELPYLYIFRNGKWKCAANPNLT